MAAIFAVNCLKKLFSVNHKIISHVVIRVLLVNWLIFNRVLLQTHNNTLFAEITWVK